MNLENIEAIARAQVKAMLAEKHIPTYFAGLAEELMVAAFIRGSSNALGAANEMLKTVVRRQA